MPCMAKAPAGAIARQAVLQALVLGQITGVHRAAIALEVGRRPHQQDAHLAQGARNQARIAQVGNAQRQVEAVADQVHLLVGKVQVQLHIRVHRHEPGQDRRQPRNAKRHRRGNADLAAQAGGSVGDIGLHRLAFLQDARGPLQRAAAGVRQCHAARGAVEQAGLHAALQPRDGLGHRCLRQRQLGSGARERSGLGHLRKNGPGLQVRQLAHGFIAFSITSNME